MIPTKERRFFFVGMEATDLIWLLEKFSAFDGLASKLMKVPADLRVIGAEVELESCGPGAAIRVSCESDSLPDYCRWQGDINHFRPMLWYSNEGKACFEEFAAKMREIRARDVALAEEIGTNASVDFETYKASKGGQPTPRGREFI